MALHGLLTQTACLAAALVAGQPRHRRLDLPAPSEQRLPFRGAVEDLRLPQIGMMVAQKDRALRFRLPILAPTIVPEGAPLAVGRQKPCREAISLHFRGDARRRHAVGTGACGTVGIQFEVRRAKAVRVSPARRWNERHHRRLPVAHDVDGRSANGLVLRLQSRALLLLSLSCAILPRSNARQAEGCCCMAAAQLGLPLPRHRNQQLFADYYLNVLLPQREDWRQLVAEAAPMLAALRAIYAAFTPSNNEAQTEDGLIKPVLLALGHTFEVQAALKTPDGTKKPDYVFYTDLAALKAHKDQTLTETLLTQDMLAVGDAKFWDRPLDLALTGKGVDLFNNKNPSYQIAFYMQHSGAAWGILTNGRLWRLFHQASAYKQHCFYEVNLPELLEQPDPAAFLYFFAFFRRAAFDEHPLGLRALLQASTDFARGISEHLKQQVYAALRHVAQGFLDYTPNGLQSDPATLKTIYDHSLLVLYRLLFIFYAEARELLPLRDSSQYRESYSLDALKRKVARRLDGGKYLLPSTNVYWLRLHILFGMINAGAVPLQVATFNGGLFDPQRYPFLETQSVGDAQLLQALDKLARVDRQFIDYRDLAERHLGTIYEGLLEYHLEAIAPTDGWSVDLLNAKGERKATGSYYTPDYIVKYIVDQTVGPALQRAIAGKHEAAAQVRAILAVNVCDPAMGSGHFLVEATEYIARFLVALAVPPDTDAQGEADLAYWKRRVVQSCIYGVDLNPLAVDLAKLSLWLVTVAKNKPLSFLDHHLRCGNALVGARLADLGTRPLTADRRRPAVDHSSKAVAVQSSLLDDPAFRLSISSAVDSMFLIETKAGQTVAEVKEQAQTYIALRADLTQRYGRLANLLTAQSFGVLVPNDQSKALTEYATGRNLTVLPQMVALLEQADALAAQRAFFYWELEFPEVFFDHHGYPLGEAAGFDAVVGNPPYVRQEQLGFFKAAFQMAYAETYSGTADLFVYFFHQGVKLLRQGGKLGYISSNSWLRANYATLLRALLRQHVTVEQLIDLGDNHVFADAPDVYPAIPIVCKATPPADYSAQVASFSRGEGVQGFEQQVAAKLAPVNIHDQQDTGWQLETDAMRLVFRKLMAGGKALDEVVNGRLYRGILTGLNKAFIIDQTTRERIVRADPSSAALIKPMLRGEDLRPWYQEHEGRWLILLPTKWTEQRFGAGLEEATAWTKLAERHPSLAAHLESFAPAGRTRGDKGDYWWELRACDYYDVFEQPKIFWPDIAKFPRFSWNTDQTYLGNTGYTIVTDQPWLLGYLASRCAWFLISQTAISLGERAGVMRYRLIDQYMRRLPIPDAPPAERATLGDLALQITAAAQARYQLHRQVRKRILSDLGVAGGQLNQKLTAWWRLDFAGLRAEVQKVFKRDIPLKARDEWEEWLGVQCAKHHEQTAAIIAGESALNARVYQLFALSAEEIGLVEASTKYAYGEV